MITRKTLTGCLVGGALLVGASLFSKAQPATPTPAIRYETAIIKWDGPDKLQLITPAGTEYIRLFQTGVSLPRNIHDEEFCLNWAANHLAAEGWEPVNLQATRILMRRTVR